MKGRSGERVWWILLCLIVAILAIVSLGAFGQTCPTIFLAEGIKHYQNSSRDKNDVDTIVIHAIKVGGVGEVIKTFNEEKVSAHYFIDRDGTIYQLVDPKDITWHAGNKAVNKRSIGIEHNGDWTKEGWVTDSMYRASAALVRCLMGYFNITEIIGHNEVPYNGGFGGISRKHDPCKGPEWLGIRCDGQYWD